MRRGLFPACLMFALVPACAGRSDVMDESLGDAGADAPSGPVIVDPGKDLLSQGDKLDLVLVVDNSRNLDAAQDLLADSVAYLLKRLANPACVNGLGNVVDETPGSTDPCPIGEREFAPLRDVHIAVISTSLGGHGGDICSPANAAFTPRQNDAAHLLSYSSAGGNVPTYADKGFLAWDPAQAKNPPGDSDILALSSKLADIIRGTGTTGCGFESQLESIYRFLIDPNPYESIVLENSTAVPTGTDQVLLTQRGDFLRPDSTVGVLILSDENDCSIRDGGQYYYAAQGVDALGQIFRLPKARSECALNPNDPCCASCAQTAPAGCPPTESDLNCQGPAPTELDDPINLRCFDQKRRFGFDFLYPIERYIRGLNEPLVPDREGNIKTNPLFSGNRSANMIVVAGIVGVPWQDIVVDAKTPSLGFLPAHQIDWGLILGDPANGFPPFDPLMTESIAPRTGTHPITGAPLAPPDSPSALENPINGHERIISAGDDLQYACIFPRKAPKDCSSGEPSCECPPMNFQGNPLCQDANGNYSTLQRYAKALPAGRLLSFFAQMQSRASVSSICAFNTNDIVLPSFGYKPAADAFLRTLRHRLVQVEVPSVPKPD